MCFTETICIEWWILFLLAGILVAGIVATVLAANKASQNENGVMLNQPSGKAYEPEAEAEESTDETDEPALKVGQRILYDTQYGVECFLVLTEIDSEENTANGYFQVEVPAGAINKNADLHADVDEVVVDYDTPSEHIELTFGVEEPVNTDETDGWNVEYDNVVKVINKKE